MSRYSSQEIDEIADTLRSARDRAKPAHILFGAGCSRAAGIPLASEIVAKIGELYRGRWRGLTETDQQKYGACMKLLSPNERRDLSSALFDESKHQLGTYRAGAIYE
jgi:hypothetical protein